MLQKLQPLLKVYLQKLLFFTKSVICRVLILLDVNRSSMVQHTEMRLSFIFVFITLLFSRLVNALFSVVL